MRRRRTVAPTRRSDAARCRLGIALLMVLAVLALTSALLAGSAAWSASLSRATRSTRAAAVAASEADRVVAEQLVRWSAAEDAIPIGAGIERVVSTTARPLDSATGRVRVHRLSERLWLIAAEMRVAASGRPVALRRRRLVVERPIDADTTRLPVPRPLARWAANDLF